MQKFNFSSIFDRTKFKTLFRKSTGIFPSDFRKMARRGGV